MSLPQTIRSLEGRLLCFEPCYGWGWYRLGVSDNIALLDYTEVDFAAHSHSSSSTFPFGGEPRGIVGRVEESGTSLTACGRRRGQCKPGNSISKRGFVRDGISN